MAKSSVASKGFSFMDLDKELSKISGFETGSILANNTFSEVDEWISTGNYLLNAQLSGSLFGGIANNRSIGIAGDPSTGKTFLAMNITREAQKQDYDVIYCDTEGAIDKSSAKKFGVDPGRVRYQPIKTINDFKIFTTYYIDTSVS
jgi:RecA/RadA recombinase